MSPDVAVELERIRALADPPEASPEPARLCAWTLCGKPLVRRPGEQANEFRDRQCCDAYCGGKRCGEALRGRVYRFGPRSKA